MRLRAQGIFGTLLTISILTSTFAPQRALQAVEIETLSTAFRSQSTIISFCIASNLPTRIINSYLTGHGLGTPAQGKKTPPKPSRDDSASNNVAITEKSDQQKSAGKNSCGTDCIPAASLFAVPAQTAAPAGSSPAGLPGCIMLLFFFLLPRSSINENAVKYIITH